MRSRRSIPELAKLLTDDPNFIVRHEAAFALGAMGYTECAAQLFRSLKHDRSVVVRHEAAIGLGLMNSIQVLRKLRRSSPSEPVVEESIAIALANLEFDLGLPSSSA